VTDEQRQICSDCNYLASVKKKNHLVESAKVIERDMTPKESVRASPRFCQILFGKSCVLPTFKKICQIKIAQSPTI
jgi:hypothetical protein